MRRFLRCEDDWERLEAVLQELDTHQEQALKALDIISGRPFTALVASGMQLQVER